MELAGKLDMPACREKIKSLQAERKKVKLDQTQLYHLFQRGSLTDKNVNVEEITKIHEKKMELLKKWGKRHKSSIVQKTH